VTVDKDPERLNRVRENLERLGLNAQLHLGDAADPSGWWDGQPFDRILVDAPCSGTGVIRRHPDIKWLRRPTDIAAQAAEQRRILDALWPLLSPGGLLLYVTCSVLPAENQENIAQFMNTHPNAQASPFALKTPHTDSHTWQILPGENDMDGFFFARLRKQAAGP
jgi:16S rRNA (cytosine967-C5)-methyltransferase